MPEALVSGAMNVPEMKKTAGRVDCMLNDEPLGMADGITDSSAAYWLLKLCSYGGLDEGHTFQGFSRVTIQYGRGSQLPTP